MKREAKKRIKKQLLFLQKNKDNLVIDTDTHISDVENLPVPLKTKYLETDNYYHGKPISAEELLKEMDLAGIDMSLVWQNPSVTLYENDRRKNFETLLNANRYIFESGAK